jgi:acyl carrier protein
MQTERRGFMDYRVTLRDYIQNELLAGNDHTTIAFDDDLLLSGLLNSLTVMRLVTFIQEKFDIEVPVEDVVIEHFMTVQAITDYLQERGI